MGTTMEELRASEKAMKNRALINGTIYLIGIIVLFLSVYQCSKKLKKILLDKKCVVELNSGKIIEECGSCDVEGNFVNGYPSGEIKHYKTIKLDKPCKL